MDGGYTRWTSSPHLTTPHHHTASSHRSLPRCIASPPPLHRHALLAVVSCCFFDGTSEFTPLNEATKASTVHAEAEADTEAEAEVLYRMEQEEKRPLETRVEEEQRTLAFMLQYVEESGISHSSRWSGPKESQLQSALIAAQLKIQTTDMMRRIKDHLARAQALLLTAEQ